MNTPHPQTQRKGEKRKEKQSDTNIVVNVYQNMWRTNTVSITKHFILPDPIFLPFQALQHFCSSWKTGNKGKSCYQHKALSLESRRTQNHNETVTWSQQDMICTNTASTPALYQFGINYHSRSSHHRAHQSLRTRSRKQSAVGCLSCT